MEIKLLAFDLDGTTLNAKKEITPTNRLALKRARDAGVKLVPCTGRALEHLSDALVSLMNDIGFESFPYIITDNGAQAYALPARSLIYSKTIPEAESLDIIKKLRTLKGTTYVSFVAEGATDSVGAVWEDGKPSTGKTIIARYTETWFIPMVDVEPLIKWNNGAVRFSVDFLDEGEFRRGLALFQGNPALSISSGSPRSFELMPAGVSKGAAISFIAEKSGIPLENMMTIGDNYNDIEMVTRAGWGVAMGNAVPELKEKAKWVTSDVEENGLALAIERMLAERFN